VQCFPRCFYFYRTFGLVIEKFYQTKPTFTRPKKIDKSQRYLQNVNKFVLVVFDQLIPVILSADKMMKRQRMILFPRASSKTFNQIFISVYMYFDYWSLAYLCFFLQVPSPLFFPFEILLWSNTTLMVITHICVIFSRRKMSLPISWTV
jgi:hypothetical protein